jgi:hypothetical protein
MVKEREVIPPTNKRNSVQALVDHMVANGMTSFSANQMLHVNIPALGEYRNIIDATKEGDWDTAWAVVDSYLRGDYF